MNNHDPKRGAALLSKFSQRVKPITDKKVDVILLAAGVSHRMRGEDKLLRKLNGIPLLRRSAQIILQANVNAVHVVLPTQASDRGKVLEGLNISVVHAVDWAEGMAASMRNGVAAVSPDADAVVVALADMPDVTSDHINQLIAAFDPIKKREICRAVTSDGQAGHPVLFSRRFLKDLLDLKGDSGAKELLLRAQEFVVQVPTSGQGAIVDLDTPEDWDDWQNAKD